MTMTKSAVRIIFVIIVINMENLDNYGQSKNIISFQVSPLLSYLHIEYGKSSFRDLNGIENPKTGFNSIIKFERCITQLLTFSTGILYEVRKNSYKTGLVYDTSIIRIGDPRPYKYTASRTFKFIGIPIGLNVNYLNNSQLRIFQSFNIHFSYLLSADTRGLEYYETGETSSFSNSSVNDRNDFIFSVSSSIGICKKIGHKVSLKLEPGMNYMINNFLDRSYSKEKFFDLKLDIGIVYDL